MGLPKIENMDQTLTITTTVTPDGVAVETNISPGFGDDEEAEWNFVTKTLVAVLSLWMPEAVVEQYKPGNQLKLMAAEELRKKGWLN